MTNAKDNTNKANCKNFGKVTLGKNDVPVTINCRKCRKNNTEQFENCVSTMQTKNKRQTYSSKKYKSGRQFVMIMIAEGKHTREAIAKKYQKEFPEAPKNGFSGYLSWSLKKEHCKRVGGQATRNKKTGIYKYSNKKVAEAILAK